jgi:hypothetical protein
LVACKPEGGATPVKTEAVSPEPTADAATVRDPSDAADRTALANTAGAGPQDPVAGEPALAEAEPAEEEIAADPPGPVIPDEPYKVLILGDSLAATGIGALLERKLGAHPHIKAYRKGKSSSGLARPDFYDWMAEGKRQVELRDPDLVVVILGGNDGQDLTRLRRTDGPRVSWKDEAWADAYRERMDAFLATLQGDDRKILWLGLPAMGMRSFERKLTLIRDVQQNAVEALGDRAIYLDTIPFVTDADGNLLEQAAVGKAKKVENLRADDKIHFTMAGSEYFADQVYPGVLEALALPSVEAPEG